VHACQKCHPIPRVAVITMQIEMTYVSHLPSFMYRCTFNCQMDKTKFTLGKFSFPQLYLNMKDIDTVGNTTNNTNDLVDF
jgi:hypothetical protein